MNIDTLIKLIELLKIENKQEGKTENELKSTIKNELIGKYVIIRTYSAGVHAGILSCKEGNEVILTESRRLYRWNTANKGLSLSEVANGGLSKEKTKVCEAVPQQWLEAIEIIPCTDIAAKNIRNFEVYRV